MRNFNVLIILLSILTIAVSGCYYDIEEELYPSTLACDTSSVTYALSVEPIINSNCYVCHSTASAQGGVILDSHSALKSFADNGSLLGVIRHDVGYSAMPKGGAKLSTCNISIIEKWVNDGAPNN